MLAYYTFLIIDPNKHEEVARLVWIPNACRIAGTKWSNPYIIMITIWALVCKVSGPASIFAESISFHEGDNEMSAQYNRNKYSGGKSFQGTRDPIPVAGLKPHNCKTLKWLEQSQPSESAAYAQVEKQKIFGFLLYGG